MPVLSNPKHEEFAMQMACGLSPAKAYVKAGYSPNGARQSAHALLTNPDVSLRVLEIRTSISVNVQRAVELREIARREDRMAELQARWDWLRNALAELIEERGAELEFETPGGGTGLLRRDYKATGVVLVNGKKVQQYLSVYRVDAGVMNLIRLLLQHEKRAAEETGQWEEKPEHRVRKEPARPDLTKLSNDELRTVLALLEKATPDTLEVGCDKGPE